MRNMKIPPFPVDGNPSGVMIVEGTLAIGSVLAPVVCCRFRSQLPPVPVLAVIGVRCRSGRDA